jgi:hypothetical protein
MNIFRITSIAFALAVLPAVVAPAYARVVSTRAAKVNDEQSAASVMHQGMHKHMRRHRHHM